MKKILLFTILSFMSALLVSTSLSAVTVANATVDLLADPPTVTYLSLKHDFGVNPGQVFQAVNGSTVELTVTLWTTEQVVAELASWAPGDYLTAVRPDGGASAFFTLTVPAVGSVRKADPPCFSQTERFTDCGNGTVTDSVTGMIYLKNGNCFGKLEWAAANEAAGNLADGQCGLTDGSSAGDWRMQSKEDWAVILDPICPLPRMIGNGSPLTGCFKDYPWAEGIVARSYWSSTTDSTYTTQAWGIGFEYANIGKAPKSCKMYVWPVRGGR